MELSMLGFGIELTVGGLGTLERLGFIAGDQRSAYVDPPLGL
jgi:hypothetical protein